MAGHSTKTRTGVCISLLITLCVCLSLLTTMHGVVGSQINTSLGVEGTVEELLLVNNIPSMTPLVLGGGGDYTNIQF